MHILWNSKKWSRWELLFFWNCPGFIFPTSRDPPRAGLASWGLPIFVGCSLVWITKTVHGYANQTAVLMAARLRLNHASTPWYLCNPGPTPVICDSLNGLSYMDEPWHVVTHALSRALQRCSKRLSKLQCLQCLQHHLLVYTWCSWIHQT